jgi:hypothetical protein
LVCFTISILFVLQFFEGGAAYGNFLLPTYYGSPACSNIFASGIINITVQNLLVLDGNITAYGEDGQHGRGGSSGGSVYIKAGNITGSGIISANGGMGAKQGYEIGGGGGGGRVACYVDSNVDLLKQIFAYGGSGGANTSGGPGTVYMQSSSGYKVRNKNNKNTKKKKKKKLNNILLDFISK